MLRDIGYERLRAELGARMPTGDGLRLLQVESPLAVDHDGDDATPVMHTWMVGAHEDLDTVFVDRSGGPAGVSSRHATAVARRLVGTRFGLAPGVAAVDVYNVGDWIGSILRAGTASVPAATPARVGNHSWAATLDTPARGGLDAAVLRRVDWLAERDELITVAGIRNRVGATNTTLLASAHNVIVVGRSDGKHSHGTAALDRVYDAGRSRPHLVVPLGTSSAATPVVAAAALLLTEVASDPALSTRAEPLITRAGLSVYDAGRAETIRAILLATAMRDLHDETDERHPRFATSNGLDERFGAGQLDIHAAWRLLAGGERERTADELPASGFDFVTGLEPWTDADYALRLDAPCRLQATLSWHVFFPGLESRRFDASAELRNLDLELYARRADGWQRVASAASPGDSTETVAAALTAGCYRLVVRSRAAQRQDYALAWRCADD